MNVGAILPVYLDWKKEESYLGEAKLLEYLREELSFINEEKEEIVIYGGEAWIVEIQESEVYTKGFQKLAFFRKELYRGTDANRISEFTTYNSKEDDLFSDEED